MKNARKDSNLSNLVVAPGCRVKIIDETNPDRPMWKTLGEVIYTPKHLKAFFKQHGLADAWVFSAGSKEFHTMKSLASI